MGSSPHLETRVPPAVASKVQSFSEVVKADFLLFGGFLLFLGLTSTDSYYRAFGLRFQFLTYPWNLILFRGLLTIVRFPLLWSVILLIAIGIQIDRALTGSATFKHHTLRVIVLYILLALTISCMPFLGNYIGVLEATDDMSWETTTLPQINKIVASDSAEERCEHCVLLMMDSTQVVYFKALEKGEKNVLPQTKIRARSTLSALETSRPPLFSVDPY